MATGARLISFMSSSAGVVWDPICFLNWYPSGSFVNIISGLKVTNLLIVSARVFLIPLTYSNLRVYFDANSTPQLLTLLFLVFLSKKVFRGRWSLLMVVSASLR